MFQHGALTNLVIDCIKKFHPSLQPLSSNDTIFPFMEVKNICFYEEILPFSGQIAI